MAMNPLENWFCASSFWRHLTQMQLLPWLLEATELGEHVLEIGAGAGAATEELRRRAGRVTSLEFSQKLLAQLTQRDRDFEPASDSDRKSSKERKRNSSLVQGDAAALPFPEKTFSAVIAVLMLHHLPSREAQERTFEETFRVLRPGGVFLAIEIENNWLNRMLHIRSTFVSVAPAEASARLRAAGFADISIASRSGAYRISARKPEGRKG